ncbi:MAG TPA: acyltransferase [Dinghuibacter sp.]|jgi:peptidoglycan/LPS O-acetylase OafA/YrhL|uniref:acyltransferase family protein n=1 Tax=Dinghuibacter sp. TaxID=2024697 RepID=UPI002C4E3BEA|nr:acyltransferase [Dinghuibacter sp.]HTJ11299.1 acyltransferase [Dinghuibacter sp.]
MSHLQRKHFEVLDGLRGVAALAVVIFHFMEFVEPDYSKSFIGHGFLAVDFFFCLSGFVIAYAYDDRIGKLGLREFFRSRLIRLHPLVIAGSVLGLVGFLFSHSEPLGALRVAEIFACSLLMIPFPVMHERAYNLFSFNAPAWSLFWEYVANIAYALVLCRINRRYLTILVVVAAAGIVYVIYKEDSLLGGWSGPTFWDGLARVSYSFMAGLLIYRCGWMVRNRMGFLPLAALLVLALVSPFGKWNLFTESLIVLIYFPALIIIGAGATPSRRIRSLCVFSGRISYPLYMTHYWVIWIFGDYLGSHRLAPVSLFLIVFGAIAFQVTLAYAVMVLYDIPLRRRLSKA